MIELQHLTKRFATQGGTVVALNDINLTIRDGDVYGIIGMSGAGKSTLVRCINMLERPDEGNVIVNGKQMQDLRAADLRAARREITMIFQQFNLLMQRNCLDNICFPMELSGLRGEKKWREQRALVQKRRHGDDFQHQHAAEVCAADKARQPVQQVEHRALVVEHVTVKHPAAEHGAAHREEDVCVHPVVEGVERRRLAAQSQQHRRQRRQPDDARQP